MTTYLGRPIPVQTTNREVMGKMSYAMRNGYKGQIRRNGNGFEILTEEAAREFSVVTGFL